jgi:hypothetical protein
MDDLSTKLIFALLGVLLSFLTGLCLWLVKQSADAVKELREAVQALTTAQAVSQERQAALSGSMSTLGNSVSSVTKDIGLLSAAVSKMWDALQAAKIAKRRFSDNLTGTDE